MAWQPYVVVLRCLAIVCRSLPITREHGNQNARRDGPETEVSSNVFAHRVLAVTTTICPPPASASVGYQVTLGLLLG